MVGRAAAGNPVGEDMILQDSEGGLIALNYKSWFPVLGDLWFGWRKVKALMEQPVAAFGWFRRYTRASIDLNRMDALTGPIESYVRFWAVYRGPLFILIALLIGAVLH